MWNIDLETVIVPFFMATNATGDTVIPRDALGAPLRLGYAKDGSVKFRNNGRPNIVVAKPIRDGVVMLRENFIAGLVDHTQTVMAEHKDEYANEVKLCVKAGLPVLEKDKAALEKAIQARQEAELAEAMHKAEGAEGEPAPAKEQELVTAWVKSGKASLYLNISSGRGQRYGE